MISDERLNELEQVEGLADLVAEVRRLRVELQSTREVLGHTSVARMSASSTERDRIASWMERTFGDIAGLTLAQMIRELPEE